jgi:hypothetical protein
MANEERQDDFDGTKRIEIPIAVDEIVVKLVRAYGRGYILDLVNHFADEIEAQSTHRDRSETPTG